VIAAALLAPLALQTATIDWAALPVLPWRTPPAVTQTMNDFAGREVRARRCPVPQGNSLTVELAVLIDGDGGVRTVVPRAIDCATVEQYAAGLAAGFARNNLLPRGEGAGEQWYKTSLTFSWRK
jgi:hypothetical protein